MPASKAQQKAQNKWIAKAYDRINLTVPKGKKDTIQAHAAAQGESVNSFINRAIDQTMAQEAVGGRTTHAVDGVVSLPSGDAERAPAASEGRVEDSQKKE